MKKIILPLLLLIALSSCQGEKVNPELPDTGESVDFTITPSVVENAAPTKAPITTAAFSPGSDVGFSVLRTGTATPHITNYYNIRANGMRLVGTTPSTDADTWFYYINGLLTGRAVAGKPTNGNIDVFGYYPYNASMTDIKKVPFKIGTTVGGKTTATEVEATIDYMWATPKLNQTVTGPITLQFSHAMTSIMFGIRKLFEGPSLTLKTIKFTTTSEQYFKTEGTFDATSAVRKLDPPFTVSDEILVTYNKTLGNSSTTGQYLYNWLIIPEMLHTAGDATITATFTFADAQGLIIGGTYSFKLSDVKEAGSSTGFVAGRRYIMSVDVSNFVKFSGTPTVVYRPLTDGEVIDPIEI